MQGRYYRPQGGIYESQGKRRFPASKDYLTLANYAVIPKDGGEEVIHHHTKVKRNKLPKLEPTLRHHERNNDTVQTLPVQNVAAKPDSQESARQPYQSHFMSEY